MNATPTQYKRRTDTIEAMQYKMFFNRATGKLTGTTYQALHEWVGMGCLVDSNGDYMDWQELREGAYVVRLGDDKYQVFDKGVFELLFAPAE